jgi:hypothetical protein
VGVGTGEEERDYDIPALAFSLPLGLLNVLLYERGTTNLLPLRFYAGSPFVTCTPKVESVE